MEKYIGEKPFEKKTKVPRTVSLGVVAYNEADVIDHILTDIAEQDYPHSCMEVLLVDSASDDDTRSRMEQFAARCPELGFRRIIVLDNPKRKLASGWNVLIRESTEDIILRVDAHASIPEDFVQKNVKLHQQGEMITGGSRPNVIDQPTPWRETLLLAESSMFGSSIAPYRRQSGKTYVKSMFHAAYRREVFERAGIFNEHLGRTEDNEMNYRIREAGYKLCYDSDIVSYQHIRNSLRGMLKQKYGNGYWIGKTVKVCPVCLSIYHFVPFAFLLGIAATTILGCLHIVWPAMVMWGLYWLLAVLMAVTGVIGRKKFFVSDLLLPVLFFLLHITYGAGTFIGLCAKRPEKIKQE